MSSLPPQLAHSRICADLAVVTTPQVPIPLVNGSDLVVGKAYTVERVYALDNKSIFRDHAAIL